MRLHVNVLILSLLFISSFVMAQNYPFFSDLVRKQQLVLSDQAYCFRHPNGEIQGQNIDKAMFPASVTKLYVSYFALKKLGPHFRFKTRVLFKEGHVHIQGGNDPYFTTESLYYILAKLNELGISQVDKLTFDRNFYFNWSLPEDNLAWLLKGYLNTKDWNVIHAVEYENLIFQINNLGLDIQMPDTLDFEATQVYKSHLIDLNSFTEELIFESSPLYKHLKQMNIYSNNFIASNIFNFLGGEKTFAAFMFKQFNANNKMISFKNGAGFEPNYTNCRLTVYLIEELRKYLSIKGLLISDLISVPGEDEGTLALRYRNDYRKTLVAKTGTLRHTSTLAGLLNTDSKTYAFSIFNRTYKIQNARDLQDMVVPKIFEVIGYPKIIHYERSDYIPLIESLFEQNSL